MVEKQLQTKHSKQRALWLGIAGLLAAGMVYSYYIYPREDIGPRQPIYFSHRVHAGVKLIHCYFCHPNAERSKSPGIPTMEKCFYCHKYIISKHPQLVEEKWHYDTWTPVPWVKVSYVPDHVMFNHQPHIAFAKLDCKECHGAVETEDRLKRVKFQMQFCITCHQEKKAQLDCWLACHH